MICVDIQTTYQHLQAQITDQWPELLGAVFNARCDVGDLSNVCLSCQSDLESLRIMCQLSSLSMVYVRLVLISSTISNDELVNVPSDIVIDLNRNDTELQLDALRKLCTVPLNKTWPNKRFRPELSSNPGSSCRCIVGEDQTSNPISRSCKVGQVLLSDGWEDLISVQEGTVFQGSASDFRVALVKYATKIGLKFVYIRNSPDYIHVVCGMTAGGICGWYIKARLSLLSGYLKLEGLVEKHLCIKDKYPYMDAVKLTSKILGELMVPHAKNNPKLNVKNVTEAMQIGYGIDVSYAKARRAAEFAKVKIYGDFADSYDHLKYYCHALKITNPGSVVVLESCPTSGRFQRLFIALYASIKGFELCPPLLFVDGTFLRGPIGGILLVAVAKDGNKGLFPVAYGVVSAENTPNWCWFLRMIRDSITHPQRISYLSDRNSGLMAAFDETFDQPVHYFCLYHLLANLKARFCTGLKRRQRFIYINLFKECAYEPDPWKFLSKIQKFKQMGGKIAHKWLAKLPYNKWAISCSPRITRYGELTSNAAESFNAWILPARSLHITKMVDYIRTGMSSWFFERRKKSNSWTGLLVPTKEDLWNASSRNCITWKVILCPGNDYEVMSLPSTRVDLASRMCSCHEWQSTGFPCCHAVAVIRKQRSNICSDIEPCFSVANYIKSYSWDINPVPGTLINEIESNLHLPKLLSPILNRPIGRPKLNKRIPSTGEATKQKKKKLSVINVAILQIMIIRHALVRRLRLPGFIIIVFTRHFK